MVLLRYSQMHVAQPESIYLMPHPTLSGLCGYGSLKLIHPISSYMITVGNAITLYAVTIHNSNIQSLPCVIYHRYLTRDACLRGIS